MKIKNFFSVLPYTLIIFAFIMSCDKNTNDNPPVAPTIDDVDGNVYNIDTIGSQIWMRENLKVKHYRNGTPINDITNNTNWSSAQSGAYCAYNNDISNTSTYGLLYNWYVINDTNNIAPVGWHVPTYQDWMQLRNYLLGENEAGGKMKETGTTHWQSPNTGATNESGFTALPGGVRNTDGSFNNIANSGHWWSSQLNSTSSAWSIRLQYNSKNCDIIENYLNSGYSIRCVKD